MTDEAIQLFLVRELQIERGFVIVDERQLIVVDFYRPEFIRLERLPGEKRRIHYCEYNDLVVPRKLPTVRMILSGETPRIAEMGACL